MRLLFPVTTVAVLAVFLVSSVRLSSATDSLGRANFITKLPFVLLLLSSESHSANVWIPAEEPPKDSDGSVRDEYAEVSTVFAKPEAKVVQSEVIPSEQAVPWTSLKQEWELYKKFHANKNRRQGDDSSEDSGEEDEEEEDEEQGEEKLPQAFYGQQNSDDDERDFLQKQKDVYKNKKNKKKVADDSEEDEEEDDDHEAADTDASYSDIQGLDNLSHDEKQAIIDKLFGEALGQADEASSSPVLPQAVSGRPRPGPPAKESEEDDEPQDNNDEEDEDQPQSDVAASFNKNKGEQDDEDGGGHGKKDKKKKKKKKGKKGKGGGGWGWKKPIVIPISPPKDEGWGWKKHDGLLEQLVKGSTWERVLSYYHHQNDASHKKGDEGWGWGKEKPDLTASLHTGGEKLVTKLFKGSFWDRAFQTYSQYKNNNVGKPNKEYEGDISPLTIDW